MPRSKPKWLEKRTKKPSTRERSGRQEKKLAEDLGGQVTVNSGATFAENDVRTKRYDIEAKITGKKSYSLKQKEMHQLKQRSEAGKTPLFIIEFENEGETYVVMDYNDFLEQLK